MSDSTERLFTAIKDYVRAVVSYEIASQTPETMSPMHDGAWREEEELKKAIDESLSPEPL